MRALLLYNPRAGTGRKHRRVLVHAAADVLERHGFAITIEATEGQGTAAFQARNAISAGVDVVFACGGDGTVHDVLQALVGSTAALAIIPMGSANVLARELGISMNPVRAAEQYATWTKRRIAAGRLTLENGSARYFLSMVGAGPDGLLMYEMLNVDRGRWGRSLYYGHALRLFLKQRSPSFSVQYRSTDQEWQSTTAVSAMALRVGDLGGIFRGIARGASLDAADMKLVLVDSPGLLSLPLWFVMSWLGLQAWNPLVHTVLTTEFCCKALSGDRVHAQGDGEWIGTLPLRVQLMPDAVTMLLPATLPVSKLV